MADTRKREHKRKRKPSGSPPPARLLHDIEESRAILGGIGRSTFYAKVVKPGRLKLRKIGNRSFAHADDLRRIASEPAA